MSFDFQIARERFPQLKEKVHGKDLIYFDNAATTLKTDTVIEATSNHYSSEVSNVHRGVHHLSEQGTIKYEQTRENIQKLINAEHSCEIIYTKGTTEGINLVATSFGLENLNENDEVILSEMEHHSNIVPWQIVTKKTKAKLKVIPVQDDGSILINDFKSLLSDKTKIVSISHISNTMGIINPIEDIIKLAHEKNAVVLIDAAQSIAHHKIDVKKLDCDFLCFSAHKLFGPTNLGVLYGKKSILENMTPYQYGGAMISEVSFENTSFSPLPGKFEAGTPHISGAIAFNEAIKYLETLDLEKVKEYETMLVEHAATQLKKISGLKIIGSNQNKCSVISFIIDGIHHHDLGTMLDQQGIAIRTGHHCTQPLMKRFSITGTSRVSFAHYNTIEEIDFFIKALNKAIKILR